MKDKTTSELLELTRDETLGDDENMKLWDELTTRSPFDYYDDRFREIEQKFKKVEKNIEDIGTLVAVNHKLNTIISLLNEANKPKLGRPRK